MIDLVPGGNKFRAGDGDGAGFGGSAPGSAEALWSDILREWKFGFDRRGGAGLCRHEA